jgi:hypothetical protein
MTQAPVGSASVSLGSLALSFITSTLPVVQYIAALVAIGAGLVTLYKLIKK